ncbi:MAG TPA: LptF/LptG family permease [Acidobacteriota bacterium]|nr:LptF/LptG family permease [Acidobacteriota bacterium]
MSKIHKLLYIAIIPPFLIALTVLTFVVFVHEFGRLSELLITRNASPETIAIIAATLLPKLLLFSLPLSYLIGILIGLSGLSSESQITALRACGVPIRTMLWPVLTLGGVIGVMTVILSVFVLPNTNDVARHLMDRISLRQATAQIQPRVFNDKFPPIVIYLDDLAVNKQRWSRVFLVDNSNPKTPRTLLARDGTWVTDPADSRLQLHLEHGTIYEVDPDDPRKDNVSEFAATDIPLPVNRSGLSNGADIPDDTKVKKPEEISTADLWGAIPAAKPDDRLDLAIELHRRFAVPFSVLPFALLGLPLGVSTRKGGRTSGFILGLVFVLLFYILFFNGIRLAHVGKLQPWLGAWSANLILITLGLAVLTRAEQRGRWLHWFSALHSATQTLIHWFHLEALGSKITYIDNAVQKSTRRLAGFRFPKVLDLYVSRGFFVYFLWSLLTCGSLFIILTLFDLLDNIIRNRISLSFVIDYFVFLTPQILMWVVPMSVLLAILINFGILEKYSEVTALKAGGWSLYRISMPVFLIAAVLCVNMYLLQDYILPYANIRQDSIRNVIKGKPARSSSRPQRNWLFGESNRIFNYAYYDAGQNLFVDLNIFEIDFSALKVLRRFHASRARIENTGFWMLEDGWVRDFRSESQGFQKITKAEFPFPEKTSYFQKEILEPRESSKLTYFELKNYISYLRKAGYNATELQVELYKKISFPLSCIVMALLGVPFSFSTGRKGAFFGITASIAIAISYWGIFSVFEQMGSYGLLVPLLAAWAPNLLFASAGLVLLFTIRT